ncbi:UNVERIFIED_CONTAM: hypothetical protein HHA_289120 [Hammondia hammondi]|eukprot:XP_008889093.1 hypothetical protein HHA_289120 [Hammondia hammondi]
MASISSFLKRKVKDRLSLLDAALEADTLVTRLKASLSRLFEGHELPGPLPSLSPSPGSPRSRAASASPPESRRVSLATERKGVESKERTEPLPEKGGEEGPSKPLASSGWSQTRRPPPAHAVPSLVSPLPVDTLEKFQQLLHQLLLLCRQQKALAVQASQKKLGTQTASSSSSGSVAGSEAEVAAKAAGPGDDERAAFGGLCTSLVTHPSGLRVLCACLHLGKAYSDKSASSAQLAAVASILQDALEILDLLCAAHAPTPLARAGPRAPARPDRPAARGVRTPQPGTGDMSVNEAEKPRGCFSPKDGVDWRCGDEADLDETSSDGDSVADEETSEGEEGVEARNRGTATEIKGAFPAKSKAKPQRASDASPGVYFELMDSVMRHTENGSLVISLLLLPEVYIEHDVLLVLQKLYSFADDTRRRGREAARRRRREMERREEALGEEEAVDPVRCPWLSSDRFRRARPSSGPLGRPRRDGREQARGGQRKRDGEFLNLEEQGSAVCQQLEDALLNRPECIARLTAALQEGGAAEFVREEALEVLRMVTRRREEMKVIATFQGAIEALLSLLSSELGLPLYVSEDSLASTASSGQSGRTSLQQPPLETTQVLLSAPRVRSILRCIYSLTSCGPACKYMREANLLGPLVLLLQLLLRAKEEHVKHAGRLGRQINASVDAHPQEGGTRTANRPPPDPNISYLAAAPGGLSGSTGSPQSGVRTPGAAGDDCPRGESAPLGEFHVATATPLDEALFLLLAIFGNFFPYPKKLDSFAVSAEAAVKTASLQPPRRRVHAVRLPKWRQEARWTEAEVQGNQTALRRSGVLDLIAQHVAKVCHSLSFFSQADHVSSPLIALVPNLFRLFTRLFQLLLALLAEPRRPQGRQSASEAVTASAAAQMLLSPSSPPDAASASETRGGDRHRELRQAECGGPPSFYCLAYAALQGGAPPVLQALLTVSLDVIVSSFPAVQEHILEGCLAALGGSSAATPSLPSISATSGPAMSSGDSRTPDLSSALPPTFCPSLHDSSGRCSPELRSEGDSRDEPPPLQILPPGVVLAALLQWAFQRGVHTAEAARLAEATAGVLAAGAASGSAASDGTRWVSRHQEREEAGEERRGLLVDDSSRASWRWHQACVAMRFLAFALGGNPRLSLVACTRPLPSLGERGETRKPLLWQIAAVLLPALSRCCREEVSHPCGERRPPAAVTSGDEERVALHHFFCRTLELLLALLHSDRLSASRFTVLKIPETPETSNNPESSALSLSSEDAVALSLSWLLASPLSLPSLLLLLLRGRSSDTSPPKKETLTDTPHTLTETLRTLLDASAALVLDRVVFTLDVFAELEIQEETETRVSAVPVGAGRQGRGGGSWRAWRRRPREGRDRSRGGEEGRWEGGEKLKRENTCPVRQMLQLFPQLHAFFADWRDTDACVHAQLGEARDEASREGEAERVAGSRQEEEEDGMEGHSGRGEARVNEEADGARKGFAQRAEEAKKLLVEVLGVEQIAAKVQKLQVDPAFRFSAPLPVASSFLPSLACRIPTRRSFCHSGTGASGASAASLRAAGSGAEEVFLATRVPAALYSQTLATLDASLEVACREADTERGTHADPSFCATSGLASGHAERIDRVRVHGVSFLPLSAYLALRPCLPSFFAFFLLPRETTVLRCSAVGAEARGLRMLLAVSGKRAERSRAGRVSPKEESQELDDVTREDFEEYLLFQEESIAELRRENARLALRTAKLQDALDPRREALVAQLQRETSLLRAELERLLKEKSLIAERLAGERRLAAAQLEDQQRQLEAVVVAFSQLEEELQTREEEIQSLRVELESQKAAVYREDRRRETPDRSLCGEDSSAETAERVKSTAALATCREELLSLQEKHTELLALLDLLVHRVPECLQFVCSLSDLPCRYTREFRALSEKQADQQPSPQSFQNCENVQEFQTLLPSSACAPTLHERPQAPVCTPVDSSVSSSETSLERAGVQSESRPEPSSRFVSGSPSAFASSCSLEYFPSSADPRRPPAQASCMHWESDRVWPDAALSSEALSGSAEQSFSGGRRELERREEIREEPETSFSRLSCHSGATSPSFPPSAHRGAFSEASPQDETTRDTPTQIPSASLPSSSPSSPSSSAFPHSAFTASPASGVPGTAEATPLGVESSLALVGHVLLTQPGGAAGSHAFGLQMSQAAFLNPHGGDVQTKEESGNATKHSAQFGGGEARRREEAQATEREGTTREESKRAFESRSGTGDEGREDVRSALNPGVDFAQVREERSRLESAREEGRAVSLDAERTSREPRAGHGAERIQRRNEGARSVAEEAKGILNGTSTGQEEPRLGFRSRLSRFLWAGVTGDGERRCRDSEPNYGGERNASLDRRDEHEPEHGVGRLLRRDEPTEEARVAETDGEELSLPVGGERRRGANGQGDTHVNIARNHEAYGGEEARFDGNGKSERRGEEPAHLGEVCVFQDCRGQTSQQEREIGVNVVCPVQRDMCSGSQDGDPHKPRDNEGDGGGGSQFEKSPAIGQQEREAACVGEPAVSSHAEAPSRLFQTAAGNPEAAASFIEARRSVQESPAGSGGDLGKGMRDLDSWPCSEAGGGAREAPEAEGVSVSARVREHVDAEVGLGVLDGGEEAEEETRKREEVEAGREETQRKASGGDTQQGGDQAMMSYEDYLVMLQGVDERQLTPQQLEEWRNYRTQCEAFFAYQRQYAQWQPQA